jgi:hypothetical protein
MFLPTFGPRDFPQMEQEGKPSFSVYKGVVIKWDEDHDWKVTQIIDTIPADERRFLVIIQEHEECLSLVWHRRVPRRYRIGKYIRLSGGEVYRIYDSRVVGNKPMPDYWTGLQHERE